MFVIRNIFTQSLSRGIRTQSLRYKQRDPGISLRTKLVNLTPEECNEDLDMDDFELDTEDVGKSYSQYRKETLARKERLKYLITKQRYFKEKFPNFLTWHDKEQIRYLYRSDPEKWTVEHLSESFPALPHVIAMIVNSNWTKNDQQKISNHDKSVQTNWESFKSGKMPHLPEELVEHLNKFSNRAPIHKPFEIPNFKKDNVKTVPKKTGTEFSDIISSYEKLNIKALEEKPRGNEKLMLPYIEDSDNASGSKGVTLSNLQERIEYEVTQGKTVEEDDKLILQKKLDLSKKQDEEMTASTLVTLDSVKKYGRSLSTELNKTNLTAEYPEKIKIPAAAFKKGCLYKLNDCFYTDDGCFLYRVPGLYNV